MAQGRIGNVDAASGSKRSMQVMMETLQLLASIAQDGGGGGQSPDGLPGLKKALAGNQRSAADQIAPPDDTGDVGDSGSGGGGQGGGMQGLLQALQPLLQMFAQMQNGGGDTDSGGGKGGGTPPPLAPFRSAATKSPPPAPTQPAPQPESPPAPPAPPAATTKPPADAKVDPGSGSPPPTAENPPPTSPDTKTGSGKAITGPANGKYDTSIEKYAKENGLDPNLVKCVIAKESQGNPDAVSSAGAYGLGQIKPETASYLAGRPVTGEELKNNTDLNIELTCKYLAELKQQKGGSQDDMLGAYNQGPLADWRSIPESQDYVKSIDDALAKGELPTWG